MSKIRTFLNTISKYDLFAFVAYLGIAIYYIIGNNNFPSIDGPTHIHNSLLLKEYFSGNKVVQDNYELNSFYIPNIFSNFFIMCLLFIFNSKVAIVVFQLTHYLGFFITFKYFLNFFKVKNAWFLSLLAVLFFNTFLFNIGFYNFSFSLIFLILTTGFYLKNIRSNDQISFKDCLLLFVLLLLLYYSNALSFVFFGLFVFLSEFRSLIKLVSDKSIDRKKQFFRLGLMAIVFLPFLVMLIAFQNKFSFGKADLFNNDVNSYLNSLLEFNSFIVYDHENELVYTIWIAYSTIVLFISTIIWRIVKKRELNNGDILLLVALFSFVLFLIIPDNYNVGMMSPRLMCFFYVFVFLWILIQEINHIKIAAVIIIIIAVFFERDRRHIHAINNLNKHAEMVIRTSEFIEKNSVVLPIDFSGLWLEGHFSNYLGINKPMVILENYEAIVGWFPLRWRFKGMPNYLLGDKINVDGCYNTLNWEGKVKRIDYVFIYGDQSMIKKNLELFQILNNYYGKVTLKDSVMCGLYKLNERTKTL